MDRMRDLALAYPDLAARDLVLLATCCQEGIETIVSPERGFDRVDGVTRVDPSEAESLL